MSGDNTANIAGTNASMSASHSRSIPKNIDCARSVDGRGPQDFADDALFFDNVIDSLESSLNRSPEACVSEGEQSLSQETPVLGKRKRTLATNFNAFSDQDDVASVSNHEVAITNDSHHLLQLAQQAQIRL